jgi:hypothetical protein
MGKIKSKKKSGRRKQWLRVLAFILTPAVNGILTDPEPHFLISTPLS